MKRRDFLKASTLSSGALLIPPRSPGASSGASFAPSPPVSSGTSDSLPDLRQASWIWYPSERCLPNSFFLFRRPLELAGRPRSAKGWLAASSRYQLFVNGKRVQWGPAPSDPRWLEADPIDLADVLEPGPNVIGVQVLYYGEGDGAWPLGKPGLLFWLELEHADARRETLVSDSAWKTLLARAWPPGHYKRWYLRALQEEFDARLYPYRWSTAEFATDQNWLEAMVLDCPTDKPPVCSKYPEYLWALDAVNCAEAELRPRSIPLMRELDVPVSRLTESLWIEWMRTPEEYFEFLPPESYRVDRTPSAEERAAGEWTVRLEGAKAAALTFDFTEEIVGWPHFSIEAPAGTVVELMVHEAHEVGGPALLNTHFNSWSRFICREGVNYFEPFDYEAARWLQLHIHGSQGAVIVREVGMRRRIFPWPNVPRIRYAEPALQKLMGASINTLNNSALETLMDGVARERQQYSGDVGHQLHAIHLGFGEQRLVRRYLTTFSQGMTPDGYFLDCWPAYDRLARAAERQADLTRWGPILDHGVGFIFDCHHHYLYSGDLEALREPYPRLLRFAQYLAEHVGRDGLLPVEHLGTPSVWMDHIAYQKQRHKQCAFNLYIAAMLQHALAAIGRAFGDARSAEAAQSLGEKIQAATVRRFWSAERRLFVVNLAWLDEETHLRLCDRSLATAILFDQCPGGDIEAGLRALVDCPPEMGFSYPANAGWRLWALAKAGRADVVVKDFRARWATLDSVRLNNTLQEDWHATPDSSSEWSHCPVAPLYVSYMSLAGIAPLEPGFAACEIRPQPADLELLELTAFTVRGPIAFASEGKLGSRAVTISLPESCAGELVVPGQEQLDLEPASRPAPRGLRRYRLPPGETHSLALKFT